jgi:hypothetical protein
MMGGDERKRAGYNLSQRLNKKEVTMQKPNSQIFVAFAAFLFITVSTLWPVEALLLADDGYGTPILSDGVVEESENSTDFLESLKDDRLIAVEEQYEDEIAVKSTAAKETHDPNEAEQLQQEIHDLKAEAEISAKEVLLDIAIEKDDEEKISQLEDVLDDLYNPEIAQPFDDGIIHSAAEHAASSALREKDPDEI